MYVFYFAFIILSIIGLVELIRRFVIWIYRNRNDNCVFLVCTTGKNSEDTEYTLRSCAARIRWMGTILPSKVICIDYEADDNTRKICELVCSEYEFMTIVKSSELCDYLLHNS